MSMRKFTRKLATSSRAMSASGQRLLDEAYNLSERKQWIEAQALLVELNRQRPNREEILVLLAQSHYYLKQFGRYLELCRQVCKLRPAEANHRLALAQAYLLNDQIVLARRAYLDFLTRWPMHEDAGEARETLESIETALVDIFRQMGLSGEDAYDLAALNEEAQRLLELGRYREAISTLGQLLKRNPDFNPAHNNMSLAHFHLGEVTKAIGSAEHVLRSDPENFHALGNLSRFLLVSGRLDEASQSVERLKRIRTENLDRWIVQAHSCAEIGDDMGVLDALAKAKKLPSFASNFRASYIFHMAAVAALRQGREKEARRLWAECLRLSPAYKDARENLADLEAPLDERNGPWVFSFDHWISAQAVEALDQEIKKATRRGKQDMAEAIRQFLRKHPTVIHLLPILLDRGDRLSRKFACDFAGWAKTPETLAMLREFGLGQRGSNELRLKALETLQSLGALESDRVKFWSQGEWIETRLKKTEIYFEAETDLPTKAYALYEEAYDALNRRDGIESERLLKQALEMVPDSPQLLNNLSAAYILQGRKEAAEAIAWQIHHQHPDYLFARATLANRMIERGQYDKALAMLEPLDDLDRLHVSEAMAFYCTYIHLYFKQGEVEKARHWLNMIETVAPDDQRTEMWQARLR